MSEDKFSSTERSYDKAIAAIRRSPRKTIFIGLFIASGIFFAGFFYNLGSGLAPELGKAPQTQEAKSAGTSESTLNEGVVGMVVGKVSLENSQLAVNVTVNGADTTSPQKNTNPSSSLEVEYLRSELVDDRTPDPKLEFVAFTPVNQKLDDGYHTKVAVRIGIAIGTDSPK
ncbi:MAG: hypothetical protein HYY10_02375 [Candidatus Liptonbacteria bacterium]|nr:hypothetical protein [Candidatus Liptonbacteria bacterium]